MRPTTLLPYRPVLAQPVLRRLLPGLAVSALGDGLALVAVTWLALSLAPADQRGTWTAFAVAAYTLPGAAGTVLFGRLLGGRSGAQLAGWDATVRAVALAAIPIAHLAGLLDIGLYVALLAVSSLLHPWGAAGQFTLVAELLPPRHHLAANALLGLFGQAATVVGPPLAGLLVAWVGPVWVLAVDAASFGVLAVSYHLVVPARDRRDGRAAGGGPSRTSGFRIIRRDRSLLGLLSLTFGFYLLFGPFYVAMPVLVGEDPHASAATLGAYYTAFGVGSLLCGLVTGHLRRWPLRPTLVGVVVAFGAALLPLGLGAPFAVSLSAFAVAGLAWAPYRPTSTALVQSRAGAADLPRVLAANGAVTVMAVPLGTMLGGPLTAALGARPTLLTCATAILALGLLAAAVAARPAPGCRFRSKPAPPVAGRRGHRDRVRGEPPAGDAGDRADRVRPGAR
ncbi:MFS transporter [Micromonospora maritima]|uniref:MFS transporter n=1 Tax=Micromonospora maritima TaxID=986711 RepID=A0ABW7ZN59_9ACTN